MSNRDTDRYRTCGYSRERVRITGGGRFWTEEYAGRTGEVVGEDSLSRGYGVRLDNGEIVSFYSDEFEVI